MPNFGKVAQPSFENLAILLTKFYENPPHIYSANFSFGNLPKTFKIKLAFLGNIRYSRSEFLWLYANLIVIVRDYTQKE